MNLLPAPSQPKALLEAEIPWRVRVAKRQLERTAPQLTTAEKTHFQKIAYRLPRWCWEPIETLRRRW